jgi:hypothetical protein
VETLILSQNMRVAAHSENQHFVDYLLRIGEGKEPTVASGVHGDYVKIPDEYIFLPTSTIESNPPEKQLIREIYPGIEAPGFDKNHFEERAILSPLNDDVNKLNETATEMLYGSAPVTYLGQDTVSDTDEAAVGKYPPEYLNSLYPPGIPPFKLKLRVRQPIMLIQNMDPKSGLCNVTRLIVRTLAKNSLKLRS